jgi:uncharacterized RDD family membrane protein YckC
MTCRYCGTWNDEDDHRCHRCGRRLHSANARPAPETFPVKTATAPAIHRVTEAPAASPALPAEEPPVRRRAPIQPSLFSSKDLPQIIPFESIAPPRAERKRPAAPPTTRSLTRPAEATRQQSFDLVAASQSRVARSSPEAVIYCDAPVASPVHRALAWAIDLSIVIMAVGLLLLTYHLAGGTFPQSKYTWPIFSAMAALVCFLYEAMWAAAGADTPGMRWTHLRVLDFDGREPDLRSRLYRLGGSVLSLLAAGIGLLWALTDEEGLTWHDHMSNTFPTYATPRS